MKLLSKFFRWSLLACAMAALPVCAQDVVKMRFSHEGVAEDKKHHKVIVDFTYKTECADLEKACAKFFFNDSVSPSLETATRNYKSQYSESKTYRSVPDFAHRFKLSIISNSPGKFTNYRLERTNVTYEGDTQKNKKLTWNVVYDNQRDRLLTVDDIFVHQEAAKIKESIGNRRQQLLVTNEGLVWGYLLKGELVQNKCYYHKTPLIFTEDFRKLIGGNAFEEESQPSSGVVLKAKEVVRGSDGQVFDVVEEMPSFAGGGEYTVAVIDEKGNTHYERKVYPPGQAGLFQWLSRNIKYPVVAEENGIQGRVIVTFVVERDGTITEVEVVKSVDPSLDKEAVRVTKSMPKWNPGKQNGAPVRVKYTMPVTFRLQ